MILWICSSPARAGLLVGIGIIGNLNLGIPHLLWRTAMTAFPCNHRKACRMQRKTRQASCFAQVGLMEALTSCIFCLSCCNPSNSAKHRGAGMSSRPGKRINAVGYGLLLTLSDLPQALMLSNSPGLGWLHLCLWIRPSAASPARDLSSAGQAQRCQMNKEEIMTENRFLSWPCLVDQNFLCALALSCPCTVCKHSC